MSYAFLPSALCTIQTLSCNASLRSSLHRLVELEHVGGNSTVHRNDITCLDAAACQDALLGRLVDIDPLAMAAPLFRPQVTLPATF